MSIISTDERREVARRLRKAIGLTEFAEVLGFNWTDDSDWVWNDVSKLVADLIEPDIYPDNPDKTRQGLSETCDLDALLELADEMDVDAGCNAYVDDCEVYGYARRIREALGVQDD